MLRRVTWCYGMQPGATQFAIVQNEPTAVVGVVGHHGVGRVAGPVAPRMVKSHRGV